LILHRTDQPPRVIYAWFEIGFSLFNLSRKVINRDIEYGIGFGRDKMPLICHIDVIKEGKDFVIRARLADGSIREYRNPILEDVLTEMINDLQEELAD